jgi:hypothetical protein
MVYIGRLTETLSGEPATKMMAPQQASIPLTTRMKYAAQKKFDRDIAGVLKRAP